MEKVADVEEKKVKRRPFVLQASFFLLGTLLGCGLAFFCFYELRLVPRHHCENNEPESASQKLAINAPPSVGPEKRPEILCVVISLSNSAQNLEAINSTYGSKCAKVVYYGNQLPYVASGNTHNRLNRWRTPNVVRVLNDGQTTSDKWNFMHSLFEDVATNHLSSNIDWVIVNNDRSYVMIDNLADYVTTLDSDRPAFVGQRLSLNGKEPVFNKQHFPKRKLGGNGPYLNGNPSSMNHNQPAFSNRHLSMNRPAYAYRRHLNQNRNRHFLNSNQPAFIDKRMSMNQPPYDNAQHLIDRTNSGDFNRPSAVNAHRQMSINQPAFHNGYYLDGNAGYLLNRPALQGLQVALQSVCPMHWWPARNVHSDLALADCLRSVGIHPRDGTDGPFGGHRFVSQFPIHHLPSHLSFGNPQHQFPANFYAMNGISSRPVVLGGLAPNYMELLAQTRLN